jgi:2-oxoisovalerate dehydrogenase E1 component
VSVVDRDRTALEGFEADELVADLRLGLVSRALDDRILTLQRQSRAFFQISGAGHEALLTALARSLRPGYDWFFPYYRDQALALALGISPYDLLLQAVGSGEDPASGGRQLPSHFGSAQLQIVTQSSPTGSQCLQAVGCAEAGRYALAHPDIRTVPAHPDELTYVSLGEGAASEGEFWEAVNQAALLQLPVLFVIEDNGWAISVPRHEQATAPVHRLVSGVEGLVAFTCDGTDYLEAREVGERAISYVRSGAGPALLQASVTRPYSHSSMDDQRRYRSAADLDRDAARDPLRRLAATLLDAGVLSLDDVETMRSEAAAEVADAARAALAAARPEAAQVAEHLQAEVALTLVDGPDHAMVTTDESGATGTKVTMAAALNRVLAERMEADSRIRVFGEDVADVSVGADHPFESPAFDGSAFEVPMLDGLMLEGPVLEGPLLEGKGGVFGTTKGLQRRFGDDRCFNTPLAEAAIVGRAVGQAMRGLRPVPEIQFFDYIWPAMQQLRSEAPTIRWRSAGAFQCPMIVRVPIGGYLAGGAIWHSQSGEAFFAHVPGLRIAFPSTAADAVGLFRAACRYDDPVLFLEHKHLLRQAYAATPYPDDDVLIPFGCGSVRRIGRDASIITWGAMVQKSLVAAQLLAEQDGWDVEVIDLRTIAPWDQDLVAASVRRTGRALIVHEDTLTGGFGGEIAAFLADELFSDLDAPVRRVGALDTPVPYEPELERAVLPHVDDIASAARRLLSY